MRVNADFTQRVAVHSAATPWVPSPMPGVERRMLDRIGEEVARATSVVRYAPGSAFSAHVHGGGEEFLVLDGVFTDEHGDFPAGTYVRNPPTSSHTPSSTPGCTILVKLCQFDPEDRAHVIIATDKLTPVPAAGRTGVAIAPLYADAREDVRIEVWAPDATVALDVPGGLEAFVIDGGFVEGGDTFAAESWLRLPAGGRLVAKTGESGARVWIKTGHLADLESV